MTYYRIVALLNGRKFYRVNSWLWSRAESRAKLWHKRNVAASALSCIASSSSSIEPKMYMGTELGYLNRYDVLSNIYLEETELVTKSSNTISEVMGI